MVEVYFNAQSNNGTLTDGEFIPIVMNKECWNSLFGGNPRGRGALNASGHTSESNIVPQSNSRGDGWVHPSPCSTPQRLAAWHG
jgi:hypothetical protein